MSSTNNYNYNIPSYLCELLTPFIPAGYCTKDSFSNNFYSFFTNIPLSKTIDIPVKLILENNNSKNELTKLFRFTMSQTHLYFDGKIFDQVDGVAMTSPLRPALANLV